MPSRTVSRSDFASRRSADGYRDGWRLCPSLGHVAQAASCASAEGDGRQVARSSMRGLPGGHENSWSGDQSGGDR